MFIPIVSEAQLVSEYWKQTQEFSRSYDFSGDEYYRDRARITSYNVCYTKLLRNDNAGWEVVPNNYEGVRVSCKNDNEKGWFLLRLSLHDPVIPLNIESDLEGGVEIIAKQLVDFFSSIENLDLTTFKK